MTKSILQTCKECYLCRRMYNLKTVKNLEMHHIVFGRGRRQLSEQYGLKVWLCHYHHNEPPLGVHFNDVTRKDLTLDARRAFDALHGPGSFDRVFADKIQEDSHG